MSFRSSSTDDSFDNSSINQPPPDPYSCAVSPARARGEQGVQDSNTANVTGCNDEIKEGAISYLLDLSTSVLADTVGNTEKKRKQRTKTDGEERETHKQQERLAANRRSAALSRQRKKDLIKQLQLTVMDMTKKNVELQNRCDSLERQISMYQTAMLQKVKSESSKVNNAPFAGGGLISPSVPLPLNSLQIVPPPNMMSISGAYGGSPNLSAIQVAQLFHTNQHQNQQLRQNLQHLVDLAVTEGSASHNKSTSMHRKDPDPRLK